jgi:hypothetical protein
MNSGRRTSVTDTGMEASPARRVSPRPQPNGASESCPLAANVSKGRGEVPLTQLPPRQQARRFCVTSVANIVALGHTSRASASERVVGDIRIIALIEW